ncbi:MAG: hypothetical protein HC878_20485 [Leptolyngbyaceae cyanobacterium SL_5_14]|nr:hypothetical protein [Leptolyngbyaceae cyanobacterium SL_5_14]
MDQISPVPDPWQPPSEPKIEQSAENKGDIAQQAAAGSDNNQNLNQNNINNVINLTVNDVLGDASVKGARNQTFTDPTKPLPQKPKGLPEIRLDSLSGYSKELQEDCLIIVTCSNADAALSVAYNLAEKISIPNRRLFTGEWGILKQSIVEPSVNIITQREIGEGQPTLIVVDTHGMQTFLDSLVVQTLAAASIKNDLRDVQRLCICLADSESLRTTLERKQAKLSFPHWEIPFEEEEIRQDLPKGNESQEIAFYEDGQAAILLYERSDTLGKIVLYVATFFEHLTLNDFERVVLKLVADQVTIIEADTDTENTVDSESTISVKVRDQTVTFNQSQKGQNDKELKSSKTQTKRLLREIWQEDTDQILESCLLDSRVIDFLFPHLRDELKEYFEKKKFAEYRNKFQKLIEFNLLFDTSSQVAKAVKDLSVTMMRFQAGTDYWVDWLLQITLRVLEADAGKNSKRLDHIYYCLSDLLRETLDHPELEGLVENFLEQLVSQKQHSTVLSISRRLKFAPQFDEYYWFEQSINRGNEEVRREAYQFLYNQAKQSGSRIYEILERVSAWLPDLERDPESYSPSNRYALQLLLEYSLETLEQFDTKLYGDKAFSYALFGGLRPGEFINDKLNMIVRWLLHPGMNFILHKDVDSFSLVSILIFPSLFTILFGLEEEVNAKPEVNHIVEALLQAINDVSRTYQKEEDRNYREAIVQNWRLLSRYLLEASNYEIRVKKNWDQGVILNYKRNIIDYLIERLEP